MLEKICGSPCPTVFSLRIGCCTDSEGERAEAECFGLRMLPSELKRLCCWNRLYQQWRNFYATQPLPARKNTLAETASVGGRRFFGGMFRRLGRHGGRWNGVQIHFALCQLHEKVLAGERWSVLGLLAGAEIAAVRLLQAGFQGIGQQSGQNFVVNAGPWRRRRGRGKTTSQRSKRLRGIQSAEPR